MSLLFTEAFRKLGYELIAHRTDWSAANANGVCLSLWKKRQTGAIWSWTRAYMPTRSKIGVTKREMRAELSTPGSRSNEHGGWVDVVTIDGNPGESYGDAHPWYPAQRGKRWRVTFLEARTGHLRLEAQ
jgi:hypothetical protein